MSSKRLAAFGALASLVVFTQVAAASGTFVEPVTVLHTFDDPTPGVEGFFGWEVAALGDVDHDGVQEAIISEIDTDTGTTYVYSGASGRLIYQLDGTESELHGYAIADAGDVNGDGVSDILSGAPSSAGHRGPGHLYLYSGRTGARLHAFVGETANDFFGSDAAGGSAVGSSADLNRDGVPELVVGARHAGTDRRGEAYVFSGRTGERLLEITAPPTGVDFGYFFATGVGDVDGDTTPDIYVADFRDTSLGPATGRAGVYSGVNGSQIRSFVGSAHHEGLGPGRGAGDVNRDGRPDLAVGSFMSSDGADEAGQIEIYSGADGSLLRRITSTTPDEQLGFDAIGFDDVNDDGVPELLASAANRDTVYLIAGDAP